MLNESLARSFIKQIGECTDYGINIINTSGIILASSDSCRVGMFHELAGIIEIFGPTETIRAVAPVIKKAIELMIECEFAKTASLYRKNAKELLLNYFLYLESTPEDLARIYELCENLGYHREMPRIPLILIFENKPDLHRLLEKAKSLLPLSSQDLLASDDKGHLVLFLSYQDPLDGFFKNYKFYINDFLKHFLCWCRSHSIQVCVSAGPMAGNPANYKYGYEKALWLKSAVKEPTSDSIYFYEHIDGYLKSKLPLIELHKIFEIFSDCYSPGFQEQLVSHIDVLHENNYNFQRSSSRLFIHKNTLAFCLDKIREYLGADPIQNLKDRELIEYLCYYLHQIAKQHA